jgi:hypothetical protein
LKANVVEGSDYGQQKRQKEQKKAKRFRFCLFVLFAFFAVPSPDGLNALVFKSVLTLDRRLKTAEPLGDLCLVKFVLALFAVARDTATEQATCVVGRFQRSIFLNAIEPRVLE